MKKAFVNIAREKWEKDFKKWILETSGKLLNLENDTVAELLGKGDQPSEEALLKGTVKSKIRGVGATPVKKVDKRDPTSDSKIDVKKDQSDEDFPEEISWSLEDKQEPTTSDALIGALTANTSVKKKKMKQDR